ncbi:hypothetical protein ABPG74_011252 [Tetrahymena malaccensis]
MSFEFNQFINEVQQTSSLKYILNEYPKTIQCFYNCKRLAKDDMFKLIIAIEQDTLKLQNLLVETQRQQEHFMKQRLRFAETSRKYYKYKDYSKQLEKQVENLLMLIPNYQPSINIQSNLNTLREYIQYCQKQQETTEFIKFISQNQGQSRYDSGSDAKYKRNQQETSNKNEYLRLENQQRHITLKNCQNTQENGKNQIQQDKILIVDGELNIQSRSDNLFDLKELSKELNQQQFFLNTNQYTHERIQNNNIFHMIEANQPTQKILTQSLKLDELASTVKQIPNIAKHNNDQIIQKNNFLQNEERLLQLQINNNNIGELNVNLLQIQIDVAKEQYLEKSKQYNDLKCQVQNLDLLKQDMEKVCSNNLHQTQYYVQFYRKSLACLKLVVFMNKKVANQILNHSFLKIQKQKIN